MGSNVRMRRRGKKGSSSEAPTRVLSNSGVEGSPLNLYTREDFKEIGSLSLYGKRSPILLVLTRII